MFSSLVLNKTFYRTGCDLAIGKTKVDLNQFLTKLIFSGHLSTQNIFTIYNIS